MDWAVVKQPWGYCLKYLWIQEASTYRPRQDYRRSYRCLSGIWVSFRPIFLFCTYRKLQITIWEEFTGSENHQHHEYWIPPVMAIWLYNECVTLSHLRSKGVSVVKMWCITTTVLQVCYNFPSVLQIPVECGTTSHWNAYIYATISTRKPMQTSWIVTLYIDTPYKLSIVFSNLLMIN